MKVDQRLKRDFQTTVGHNTVQLSPELSYKRGREVGTLGRPSTRRPRQARTRDLATLEDACRTDCNSTLHCTLSWAKDEIKQPDTGRKCFEQPSGKRALLKKTKVITSIFPHFLSEKFGVR